MRPHVNLRSTPLATSSLRPERRRAEDHHRPDGFDDSNGHTDEHPLQVRSVQPDMADPHLQPGTAQVTSQKAFGGAYGAQTSMMYGSRPSQLRVGAVSGTSAISAVISTRLPSGSRT